MSDLHRAGTMLSPELVLEGLRSEQRLVENVWSVRSCENYNSGITTKSIHFDAHDIKAIDAHLPRPKGKLGPPGLFEDDLLKNKEPRSNNGKAKFPNKSRMTPVTLGSTG